MGSSLILSKYATLNTYYRSMKDQPPPGWVAVPWTRGTYAHTHTHGSHGSPCTLKHKSQPSGLPFLPPVKERSRKTHNGRCGSCPRETEPIPPSARERLGEGRHMPSGSVLLLCFSFMILSSLLLPLTWGYCICYKNLISPRTFTWHVEWGIPLARRENIKGKKKPPCNIFF